MPNLSLDNDIEVQVRSAPLPERKAKPEDIFIPINGEMKTLSDTTSEEFMNWLAIVMPFSEDMINVFLQQTLPADGTSLKIKTFLFNSVVTLHERRWLFGKDKLIINKDLRWN